MTAYREPTDGQVGFKTARVTDTQSVVVPSTNKQAVSMNATGTVTTTSCTLGEIAASSDLVITSSDLKGCFGAFGRGDLRITVQTTSSNVTAKMRSTDAYGTVEQSLGGGTSVASAN